MSAYTPFSKDVLGRWVCNTLDEALATGRQFDVIVLGGGTYGGVVAHALFKRGKRVLVVEAGPFLFPAHVQELPSFNGGSMYGAEGNPYDKNPYGEVWGRPWNGNTDTQGLAYCVGGKSVFWGGWAPRYLDSEMREELWPEELVGDLRQKYFRDAEILTGVSDPSDFTYGQLHAAMRLEMAKAYCSAQFADWIPASQLPQPYLFHVDSNHSTHKYVMENEVKFEPPYAMSTATRPGFLPNGKFNSAALLIQAAREAATENVANKRFYVVPQTHVIKLNYDGKRIVSIDTNKGQIDVGNARVVLAMGAVESARLALLSLKGCPSYDSYGKNLQTHSMLKTAFKFHREVYPEITIEDLRCAAQLLRFRHEWPDGSVGHYQIHLMMSGRPLGTPSYEAFAELFKREPDRELVDYYSNVKDKEICVSVMAFAETEAGQSHVSLDLDPNQVDEFGQRRAYVYQVMSDRDNQLLEIMRVRITDVCRTLSRNTKLQVTCTQPALGATHHECGTLRLGTDWKKSAVDEHLKFHWVDNLYACDMSVVPNSGSANPMCMGVALARRLADRL